MSGRNRGRSRGRPKGNLGRGRGRGRACQTDDALSGRASRSPSAPTRSRGEGGPYLSSALSGFPLGIHPGAPPGSFPHCLPLGLQAPGLPHPLPQLSPPDAAMPRASSHSKASRHDDQSPGRVSAGMQTSMQTSMQSGVTNGRHSHDSSRQMSGGKQGLEPGYLRQNVDHSVGDARYVMDHQVRPSVRKPHRQSREFPFQEEFEPTFGGQKEKRVSGGPGPRHDKDSSYGNQKQTVDKPHKDLSHRTHCQNLDAPYQKPKKDSNYFEQKHDKEQVYTSRRPERDPPYGNSRLERDQRYLNPKHDRDPLPPAPRRGRDSPYCVPRQEPPTRSSSTESSQSAGSQYADRDASPHFSPGPAGSYHSQGMQSYMFDSRNHSGDRDSGFSKHRDHSGERYASHNPAPFSSPGLRQPADGFNEQLSRDTPRDNGFSPNTFPTDGHVHPKMGCSGKSGKSNKSGNMNPSYATTGSGDNVPMQRMFTYQGHPDSRLLLGSDPQTDSRACMDSAVKKTSNQGNHEGSGSLERTFNGQGDREKPSSRKKQTARNMHSDLQVSVQNTHQSSYLTPSPCYLTSCASEMPNDLSSTCNNSRINSKMCEEEFSNFRTAKQQGQLPDHRPSRQRRPSTPSSPSPPLYASRPPTPPLYPAGPPSPPAFPSKRVSSRHQQIPEDQEPEPCRRSARLAQCSESDCNSSVGTINYASSGTQKYDQGRRGKNEAEGSPDPMEPPPLIEPMAFQQQFVKHLHQQQHQNIPEGHTEDDPHQQQFGRKHEKQEDTKNSYNDRRPQFIREQMLKQEEQMCREYVNRTREKMQREHSRQLEELQMEHARQIEQVQREHITQLQRQMPRDHSRHQGHVQREQFIQEEERLQRDQMKELEKMRQSQMKDAELMQQELALLEQKYLDRQRPAVQDCFRREQQELTQKEHVPLQQYQYRYTQAHKQYQQQPSFQPQPKHQHSVQQLDDDECVKTQQRQLPDYIKQRYDQIQKQQGQQIYHEQCEQQKPRNCPQQTDGNDYQRFQRYSQQQLNQQTNTCQMQQHPQRQLQHANDPNDHPQQQYHPQSHQSDQVRTGHWQPQQHQQQMTHVHPQQQNVLRQGPPEPLSNESPAGQFSAYQQRSTSGEHVPPLPPWRQGSTGRDPPPHSSRQAAMGAEDAHQTLSPARLPHHSQTVSPVGQPHSDRQTASSARPLPIGPAHPSAVQPVPFPHSGNQSLVSMSTTSVQLPVPPLNSTARMQATFHTQYPSQPAFSHAGQMVPQVNQKFEANRLIPMSDPAEKLGSKSKKPPWQVDCENQMMCAQKAPPWMQPSEHAFVVPAQDTASGGVSQYAGNGPLPAGQQFPASRSAPVAMTRLASSVQIQAPQGHGNGVNTIHDVSHQTLLGEHTQQSMNYQTPPNSSSVDYQTSYSGLQTYNAVPQPSTQPSLCSQNVLPQYSMTSAGHLYTHVSTLGQNRTVYAASGQNPSTKADTYLGYGSTEDPPKPHAYLSNIKPGEARYQYQSSNDYLGASEYQPALTETTIDQECAEQVLVEALNEQINHTQSQTSNKPCNAAQPAQVGVIDHTSISVEMHSKQTIVAAHSQQHTPNADPELQSYTLHHLFDDANSIQQNVQTPHALIQKPVTCVVNPAAQDPLQQSSMESSHQVIPGNPLDTAVALLNIPESVLDIPSIEQHQVFVLEPPGRQQPMVAPASNTTLRRNSWHTPENSIAGSGSGSLGDDDAGLFNDISADLGDGDDDIFLPPQTATKSSLDSKVLLQNSVKISSMGINDLGLRISSVFSLAATRRRKRRTMSDSVLQEVEVMAQQEGFHDTGLNPGPVQTKGSSSQHNLSQEPCQMPDSNSETCVKDRNAVVTKEVKYDSFENTISRSSPDPLAQLTKMLFTDMAAPSPGATAVEDWNLNEAAGVSFEADSVCVPGTPARGEPEALATPLPHLYTPMPQLGTPRPCPYREPATPFARYSSVPQTIKMPAGGCAKEPAPTYWGKSSPNAPVKELKEPQTPWPFPVKEFKEPDTPLPSCAMGLSNPPPSVHVKSKEPSVPFNQCVRDSSTLFEHSGQWSSSASQLGCQDTSDTQLMDSALEIRVDAFQKTISENVERASKQPLEQAIRELLGDGPIGASTENSLEKVNTNSPQTNNGERVPKQLRTNGGVESTSRQAQKTLCADKVSKERENNSSSTNRSCVRDAGKRPHKRDRVESASKQPQRKSERLSAKEAVGAHDKATERSGGASTEKDIRDRVSDNWERRCVSKNTSTSKTVAGRPRDYPRECERDRRMAPLFPDASVNRGLQKMKPLFPKSVDSMVTDDDRKSCGVRGRRTITLASKKKPVGRQSSREETHQEQKLLSTSSGSHIPDMHDAERLSQGSSEQQTQSDCVKETSGAEDDPSVGDMDQDTFFPDLSPSNSSEGSIAEEDAWSHEKRRRLSSSDSQVSVQSSVSSCGEAEGETIAVGGTIAVGETIAVGGTIAVGETIAVGGTIAVGETIADLILPTVLPPLRRPRKSYVKATDTVDLLATFHDHKLQCVQLEGEHYVALEELLAKCFPGLPRDQVERARVRDLNLLTRTVHLMDSDSGGDEEGAVTVLALPDASRLLHYFHGMMQCPGKDCKLKTYRCQVEKDGEDSDPSDSEKPRVANSVGESSVLRSGSFGFLCPGSGEKKSVSRKSSTRDEDEVVIDMDGPDDTGSSSSDQTAPYCDGQPLMGWELESARKENDNSDGERCASPAMSVRSFTKKFRRHSSESESKVRKYRDGDHFQKTPVLSAVSHEEASPMLPPLPTYPSPFTPGSMYNVPMDNERVLLECFSAPGSQAPSSVRSAPSVRLLSPDRHDHPHLEEDPFAGLFNNKSLLDNDYLTNDRESESNHLQNASRLSQADCEALTNEQFDETRVSFSRAKKIESADDYYHDFTDDFNAEDPDDDVFLENETECKTDHPRGIGFAGTQTLKEFHISTGQSGLEALVGSGDILDSAKCLKGSPALSPGMTVKCHRSEMVVNYVSAADYELPTTVSKQQPCPTKEMQLVDERIQVSANGHERKKSIETCDQKFSEMPTKKCDENLATKNGTDIQLCVTDDISLGINQGSCKEESSEDNPHGASDMNTGPVKDNLSTNVVVHSPCENERLCVDESDIFEDRTTSDATFAYGGSDEDSDMHNGDDPCTEEIKSQTGDIPMHDTSHGRAETNISRTSSPKMESADHENVLEIPNKDIDQSNLSEDESGDKRRPPPESDGSLKDRVEDFIAHGSQFTPRAVVRSNSLPDLCGLDSMASPLNTSEDGELPISGVLSSRSNSYPGAAPSKSPDTNDSQSCAQSPLASLLDDFVDSEKEENICATGLETAKDTEPVTYGAASELPSEPEEHVFLDPGDVVDGGEVVTKATPRRSPPGAGDSGDQLLQWAVPCAAHGSSFCGCEGVDIHTAHDVAASPKVGPWLCTPGTPVPGTPFCDYSKLIYSPFPVVGGMTPARPEAQETPAGSPKMPCAPELDAYSCGAKRLASLEDQPAPKRRSVAPSNSRCDPSSPPCKESATAAICGEDGPHTAAADKSCEVDSDRATTNISCEDNPDTAVADNSCENDSNSQLPDEVCNENDFTEHVESVQESGMNTDKDNSDFLLENEEQELIAAAEESEKSMASLTPEEKEKLLSTSPVIPDTDPVVCNASSDCLSETTLEFMTSHCSPMETQTPDVCADHQQSGEVTTANGQATDSSSLSTSKSEETCADTALDTTPPVDCGPQNNSVSPDTAAESDVFQEFTVKKEIVDSDKDVFSHAPDDGQAPGTDILPAVKLEPKEVPLTEHVDDNKLCPNIQTPGDIPDTNSVETTDSESVNDVRIITLRDSDVELAFESEDSKDSTEASLSGRESESGPRQLSSENKKIITIAEYKERRKLHSEVRNTTQTPIPAAAHSSVSKVSSPAAPSDSETKPAPDTDSTAQCRSPSASSPKQAASPADGVLSAVKRGVTEGPVSKVLRTEGPVSKVLRTESVPAELSRKVNVELKRSSSFHGQHPAIKRFKHQRDDSLETVKAKLKKQAEGSRAGGDRKSTSAERHSADRPPRVSPKAAVTRSRSSDQCSASRADNADKSRKEAKKKASAQSEKAAGESRRGERSEKKRNAGETNPMRADSEGTKTRPGGTGTDHSRAHKRKGHLLDKNIISRCPDQLKPCSVVVSKISSFSLKSSRVKDDVHLSKQVRASPAPDERMSTGSPENHGSQSSRSEDRMSVDEPESLSEDIDIDQDDVSDSDSEGTSTAGLAQSSARTRSDYVWRRKPKPPAPSSGGQPVRKGPQPHKHVSPSPTTPGSDRKSADGRSRAATAQTGCRRSSKSATREGVKEGEGKSSSQGGEGGGEGGHQQLSDQLAELLREKEKMLADFAKRNQELEQKLEGLRVELQETKHKGGD